MFRFVLTIVLSIACASSCLQGATLFELPAGGIAPKLVFDEHLQSVDSSYFANLLNTVNAESIRFTQAHDKNEVDCLARNVYFESRNQSMSGQMAVVLVTFNRVQDPRFPKSICANVYYETRHGCAFSWVCQKKKIDWRNRQEVMAWYNSYDLALKSYYLRNQLQKADFTNGATFYHSTKVNPVWANSDGWERIAMIDDHIFYVWHE